MAYILKGESFQMVDGPYKGKKYERGKTYDDVPPTEIKRFKEVAAAVPKPVPGDKKNENSDDKPMRSGAKAFEAAEVKSEKGKVNK